MDREQNFPMELCDVKKLVDISWLFDAQPKESCITKAQVTLYELLVDFHTAATAWLPVSACGASFGDSLLRRDARAQLLQVSAGIVDAFELRFAKPPYSFVVLLSDCSEEVVDASLKELAVQHVCKQHR